MERRVSSIYRFVRKGGTQGVKGGRKGQVPMRRGPTPGRHKEGTTRLTTMPLGIKEDPRKGAQSVTCGSAVRRSTEGQELVLYLKKPNRGGRESDCVEKKREADIKFLQRRSSGNLAAGKSKNGKTQPN